MKPKAASSLDASQLFHSAVAVADTANVRTQYQSSSIRALVCWQQLRLEFPKRPEHTLVTSDPKDDRSFE